MSRPVNLYIPSNKGPQHVGEGTFLGWGVAYEELEAGVGNYSVALIEMPDGTVIQSDPQLIRFTQEDG